MAYSSFSWSLSLALLYILYVNNWIMRYAKKFLSLDKKEPKYSQKAKYFFQGQTRNKKAKIELFGRKKAKLPTLLLPATSHFSILIGQNMQLTGCHNGNEMRNAT